MREQRWMRKRDGEVLPRHTMMHPCCEDLYELVEVTPVIEPDYEEVEVHNE